jgi:hypothetical protein
LRYLANGDGIIGYTSDDLRKEYIKDVEGSFKIEEPPNEEGEEWNYYSLTAN